MYIFVAFFDKHTSKEYCLQGKYLAHFKQAFPDFIDRLKSVKGCVAYFAGKDKALEKAYSLAIKTYDIKADKISFQFQATKKLNNQSGYISGGIYKLSQKNKWLNSDNRPPLVCFLTQEEYKTLWESAMIIEKMESLLQQGDYRGVCMLFAPMKDTKNNPTVWNNTDILYRIGLACSKLSTTLLIKNSEKKKLERASKYRAFSVAFLERGASLEPSSARCTTALAYRYYSNVHELTRVGERRDANLEHETEKANEWLSRALEIYPESVKNHYRKGKLIIEKQAPYLLFGKKSFGTQESKLLREIRSVGEEHLASAITIFESQKEDTQKPNRREYSKALFVLGGYYLNDTYLPIHEYFCAMIANKLNKKSIQPIAKLNIESARELLEKCFYAETDMPLANLNIGELAEVQKGWTHSPIKKLYRLGCVYSTMAFINLVAGDVDRVKEYAKSAIRFLEAAKKVSDTSKDRKRNTWHISEKIAWVHILLGNYTVAAKLICRARGYIVNTYAIALLLTRSEENLKKAEEALAKAAYDKHNLAASLSYVLYAYTQVLCGNDNKIPQEKLSLKYSKLVKILGVE